MAPERREKLFESAAEEFIAHGYDGASLNRIIARAGMGKSSLYYYFDDKGDLFQTVIEAGVAAFIREIGGFDYAGLTAETFWPDIEALFERGVRFSERNVWYVRLGQLFWRLRGQDKASKATGHLFRLAYGWVAALLDHGIALGVVRADLPAHLLVQSVMALLEVCDRFVLETWEDYDEAGRRALVVQQADLFKRLCAPRPL